MSPSGEWVAFVGYVQGSGWHGAANLYDGRSYETEAFQIRLTSTAGTHSRIVKEFSGSRPTDKPVWSPDSIVLLVNKMRDPDNGTYDIYLSDIVTGKTTKIFKNVGPVYGWVETQ